MPPQLGPTWFKGMIATLAAGALVSSGVGYGTVGQVGNAISDSFTLQKFEGNAADGAMDILLVGSDSRTDAQGNALSQEEINLLHAGDEESENTDTMMVIRIPNDGSSATAVSIPRDSYIHSDAYGNLKINGVYSAARDEYRLRASSEGVTDEDQIDQDSQQAARQALVNAVSDLTGVHIDHYAEIGLLGFVLLTDAVGGVDVCLNQEVNDPYSGANFPAGRQTLKGSQALSFVRQRHGLPRGDFDRIVRQQAYAASLVNKTLSAGTLSNPVRLSDLGTAVKRSVTIDQGWDVMSLAAQLQDLASGNVNFSTIPITSVDGVGDYGESIVTVDPLQVRTYMEELLGSTPSSSTAPTSSETTSPTDTISEDTAATLIGQSIRVLNAGSVEGLAASISDLLSAADLTVTESSNAAPGMYASSAILYGPGNATAAEALALALGGLPVEEDAGMSSTELIVVLADDYAGPGLEETTSTEETSTSQTSELPMSTEAVGQPGTDFGVADSGPTINAGGNGPQCVN